MRPSHPRSVGRILSHRRHYATKYTAKITSTSPTGHTLSAEVTPPPPIPSDVRGYPLLRRDLICKASSILLGLRRRTFKSPLGYDDVFSNLADYLHSHSISLTTSEASEIMKSLNCPSLSLRFFQQCPSLSPKFQHDAFTYNRILLILSKSASPERFDQVRSLIDAMERSSVRGNISTVNILIGFFGDTEDLEICKSLVKKWELSMNSYTYKCFLQAYLRSYNVNKAVEIYNEMRRKGYKLDIFAYNMILDALAKDGKTDSAYRVFRDMRQKHVGPDEFSYTIMIRMSGRMGKSEEALALFHEMVEKGYTPRLISYNTVIEAAAKGGMVDTVINLFSDMVKTDCKPNEFTYSIILKALVAEGQLSRLDEIVEMSKNYMNRSIYAYLVKTLGELGHAGEAHRLFCSMWSYHDNGDRDAYLSMLDNLCKAEKTVEAMEFLDNISKKGVEPDTFMYNMVISALGKSKQISHIFDLYEKMKRVGPRPDIYTYNVLISSFGRAGKVDEAVKIFEELEQSDYKPDIVSYNSLINCLGKNGDIDEAHMKFKEMEETGICPDVVTYSTLIECFGKTDKVDMACRLFDEMVGKGCCPNIVTYNILLDCLERCGRTGQAVDLYGQLKQQGLSPDSITYTVLERLQSGGAHRKGRVRRQDPITGWVVSPLR